MTNEKKYFIVSIIVYWKSYHVKDIMKIKEKKVAQIAASFFYVLAAGLKVNLLRSLKILF